MLIPGRSFVAQMAIPSDCGVADVWQLHWEAEALKLDRDMEVRFASILSGDSGVVDQRELEFILRLCSVIRFTEAPLAAADRPFRFRPGLRLQAAATLAS